MLSRKEPAAAVKQRRIIIALTKEQCSGSADQRRLAFLLPYSHSKLLNLARAGA
jgi:hypothetical protein